ncbi:hypothetical protein FRC10_001579 [Ceratobasidium sp. 414]|nr:hypothetical protein FRC10_001579 [Ceratobasidium sp. 414]
MTTSISHRLIPQLQDWGAEELQDRVANTRFAFRVFDDLSRGTYDPEQGFKSYGRGIDEQSLCLYQSAAHHVDRSFQVQSPWISASRRWDWALWEMARRSRRYAANFHIRVAIIDVYALSSKLDSPARPSPHIYHALLLLEPSKLRELGWRSTWSERLPTQLQHFANIADEILFLEHIPASAVVSVVALDDIIRDVPGYPTGWLKGASFRDAHAAMCNDHLSCSNWDLDVKALEYVNFALALLRPTYNNLRTMTWSLFFEVARDSPPSLVAESLPGDFGNPERQ